MSGFDDDIWDWGDEDYDEAFEFCPSCQRHYDQIDYEYQSCSKCGWDAEDKKFYSEIRREPSDEDYLAGDADILTGQWY